MAARHRGGALVRSLPAVRLRDLPAVARVVPHAHDEIERTWSQHLEHASIWTNGDLSALDTETGRVLWSVRGNPAPGWRYHSPDGIIYWRSPGRDRVLWLDCASRRVGHIHTELRAGFCGTPCVDREGGMIYASSMDNKLCCLDLRTLRTRWTIRCGPYADIARDPGPGGGLFALRGGLARLDPRTGARRWSIRGARLRGGSQERHAAEERWDWSSVRRPLAVRRDRPHLYCAHCGTLSCVERESGALVWQTRPPARYRPPIHACPRGLCVERCDLDDDWGGVACLDPDTGEERWSRPIAQLGCCMALAPRGDVVYACSPDGYMLALCTENGEILWRLDGMCGNTERAALCGDRVFIASSWSGVVTAADTQTQSILWRTDLRRDITTGVLGPCANGLCVTVGTAENEMIGLRQDTGAVQWRRALAFQPTAMGVRVQTGTTR